MKQGYPYKNPSSYQKDSDDFDSDPPGAHNVASDQPSFELQEHMTIIQKSF